MFDLKHSEWHLSQCMGDMNLLSSALLSIIDVFPPDPNITQKYIRVKYSLSTNHFFADSHFDVSIMGKLTFTVSLGMIFPGRFMAYIIHNFQTHIYL